MTRRPVGAGGRNEPGAEAAAGQRVDQWLFFARLAKSRSIAQRLVAEGHLRINREKQTAASRTVKPGDVLTLTLPGGPRVIRVLAKAIRRGPAAEARLLYDEIG